MSFDVQFPGLGLEFTINRVALSIGGFNIYWYGVIIAAGMVLAMLFAFRNADDFGINSDRLIDVILVGAVMAIVCARIYYIVFAPFKYESIWQMIDIRQGGIAIYGAVIGAFVFGGLMAKIRRIPILPLFDLVGICLLIGQGVGRWGNFVNQEAFGSNTTLPWGMYSEGTYNYLLSVQATLAAEGVTVDPTQPVHPTFLYESIWCLVGVVLLASHIKKRRFNGELFLLYIIWYGLGRYWIEGLRTDALMVTSTLRTTLRFFQFRHDCGFDRAHKSFQIHTVMLVKLLVLNTDNRCDKILWNILVFDILRILVSPSFRDQFSVFIKNGAGL